MARALAWHARGRGFEPHLLHQSTSDEVLFYFYIYGMKKILAFTGSNHSKSINRQLMRFALELVDKNRFEIEEIDLQDFEPIMLSIDEQRENGIPKETNALYERMQEYDGFIIASPEHNGSTPAFLKNITDWLSRKDLKFFDGKPLLLLSTSNGKNGGKTNIRFLEDSYKRFSANVSGTYSLPEFKINFQDGKISDGQETEKLKESIAAFEELFH